MIQLLRKALLVSLVAAFVLLCAAGCQNNQSGGAISAVSEEDFLTKLADSSVQEITLSGDLVLTSPVEVTGSKTLLGTGTVTTAVQDMEGEYLISLASGAELTLGGDVVIDASGVIGGIHVGKDASWILQDNAVVKNASEEAANALVEGTFRMDGGALTDAKGHNLYNKNETVIAGGSITGSGAKFAGVYNEGKLTQDGGTISGAYNNIVVTDGAMFDWNSGVNQDSVRDGVFVYAGAKLFVGNKEAQLLNSGARGIVLFGDATIDGITLKSSGDTQLKIAKGADLTLNGGVISEGNYHGVDNAGTMLMTGGDIFSNNDTGIVNTGTLEVTGGGIMTNGEKGIVNKHAGNAKVVSEDVTISGNRVAIGNEDTAIFELAKANILQSGNANIYAYDGEMYIHDIALNASASNNIRVMIADVTLKNVEIKGNTSAGSASTHGLLLEGGTVYGENVTISNTTGSGIRNKGGYLEGKNFTFKKIGQVAINTLDQDVTGRPGSTIIDGMTTEEAGYMNILSGGTGLIDVKNAVLCATPSNNVRANSGTVKLTNVEILGHSDKATTSHHGVYLEGGEIIANNVSIVNTKGHAIRNKGGAFTGYGVYIDGVNGDTAISNTVLADGSTGPITLYNVSIYNVKSKNIVNEAGTTYVYNSTLSPTPGSNIKITGGGVVLNNVNIQGSSAEAQGTIHAIILENGYGTLTADNVTIRNGKTSAIRNKTGLVNVTNLTVEDCGSAAVWNGNDAELKLEGETNINGLKVTGCANSFTVDAGKVTVKTATLGPATTNNVRVNGGSLHMEQVEVQGHVEGSAANIHGIYVPGGTLTAVDLTVNNTSGSALRIAGGNMTAKNVVLTDIGQAGVNSSGGVTEITGLKTTNVTSTNIVAGGSVTEDGKTVEAVVKITDGDLYKVTDAHNVKVTQYGTVELNKVSVNGAAVVKDNRYGIIAEGGAVKLTDVAIKDIDYSAIHANKETSIIEGTNVTVDGAAYAITGSNGKVTIDKLTTSNVVLGNVNVSGGAFALSNSELAKTTSDSTDSVTGHNIKSTGTAVVTLNKVDVLGTTEAAHAILAEGGDVVLNEVTIADAGNAGIRVNEETSTVTGKNVTIDTVSVDAVSVANGSVEIDGLTTKAVKAANIVAGTNDLNTGEATSGGTVKISNAELCKPTGDAHSVKAEGTAVVELNNVKVNGTSSASKYAVMAQGGDVKLTDVTIKDCAKSAIHANRDTSVIEGKNIVIEDAAYGITGSAGEITLDTLTASNVTYHNVDTSGVDVAISNATIGKTLSTSADETTAHSVKTTGGTVTLTNVDVLGTTESAHAILAEGGDVVLTDVKISEAGNAGIRINRGTSSVTGENVSIDGAVSAITGNAGEVEITNLTTAGILGGNNLLAESSCSIKVTDGDLCKTTNAHNVKTTTGAEIELNNVTVRGTAKTSGTDRHAVFSEGGDIVLNDVTIMDAQHTAVRINNALGSITGEKVDVQNAFEGITATNGSVNLKTVTIDQTSNTAVNATTGSIEIDGLTTTNIASANLLAGQNKNDPATSGGDDHEIPDLGGSIKVKNATLCKPTAGHSVRSYGNATVELIDTTINGTNGDSHGILAQHGDVKLTNVTINNVGGTAIRVNKANSKVEGKTISVDTAKNGAIYAVNGEIEIDGLTTANITGNSIAAGESGSGGTIKVNGGTIEKNTGGHGIRSYGSATVELSNLNIKGVKDSGRYVILAQDGDVKLDTVTISGGAAGKAVIWVNRASSEVTGKNVTVQNTDYGVGGSAGSINIDGLTGSATGRNIVGDGASVTLSNSTLNSTSTHNIKVAVGTLTLDTVTINGTTSGHGIMIEPAATQEMQQPVVNLTGVTISGTAGDAIRNKGGVVTASNVTIKSAGGNGVTNMIHNDGSTWASMTLTGSHIYGTTGREIENQNYLTVGDILLGYGDGDTNGGILYQGTTTPVTLTSALRHTEEKKLTIDASDSVWVLGANLVACADADAAKAANLVTTEPSGKELHISAMDKYLQLTLEEGGNFYVQVVEDGTMYATINEAVAHIEGLATKKGTIKLLRDVTVSQSVTINDGVDVKIIDNGEQRDIVRAVNDFPMFTVNAGAKLEIEGTANDKRIFIDAKYSSNDFTINGTEQKPSTVTVKNVDVNNPGTGGGRAFYVNGSTTLTVTNSTIGGIERQGNYKANRNIVVENKPNVSVSLTNVKLLATGDRNFQAKAGNLSMKNVQVLGAGGYCVFLDSGSTSVLVMEDVTIENVPNHPAIRNNAGVVYGTNVTVKNSKIAVDNGSNNTSTLYEGREVTITNLSTSGITDNNVEVRNGSVMITNTDPAYKLGVSTNESVDVQTGTLVLNGVTIEGSTNGYGVKVAANQNVQITNSEIYGCKDAAIYNAGNLTIGTDVLLGYASDAATTGIIGIHQATETPVKLVTVTDTSSNTVLAHSTAQPMLITATDDVWTLGRVLVDCDNATIAAQLVTDNANASDDTANDDIVKRGRTDKFFISAVNGDLALTNFPGGNYVAEVIEDGARFNSLNEAIAHVGAMTTKKGTIKLYADIQQNSKITISDGMNVTITDDGNVRTIIRGLGTDDLFNVEANAKLTLKSSVAGADNLVLDSNNTAGNGTKALVRNSGGTVTIRDVETKNVTCHFNLYNASGTMNVYDSKLADTTEVCSSVWVNGGTVTLDNVEVGKAGSNALRAKSGTLNLKNVKLLGSSIPNTSSNYHGIYIDGGSVVSTGTLTMKDVDAAGIRMASGSFNAERVNITNAAYVVWSSGGDVKITVGGEFTNIGRSIEISGGNVALTGVTIPKNNSSHNIKLTGGSLSLTDAIMNGSANYGIITENGASVITLNNVEFNNMPNHAIHNKNAVITGTNVRVNGAKSAINNTYDAAGKVDVKITNLSVTGAVSAVTSSGGQIEITNEAGATYKNANGEDVPYKLSASADHNVSITGGTATLNGVTIEGSSTEGKYAVNNAATVTLTNCTVNGPVNNTKTATITGGTYAGTVTNTDALTVNSGSFSGAVNNSGTLTVKDGTFSGAVESTLTANITGGTFSGGVTNSSTATVSGATFTGGFTNSGTATLSGASFSGGADGKAISTSGALTISNITVDGKLYVASAAVPVTYTGTTSAHTADNPLVIVTDAASFVGGTNLVKCDDAAAATALAATFKAQDANGNLIPLVAQGEYLALAAARYNGVAYASIEDAMDAGRVAYPSITPSNRQTVYDNPVELLSNVVLTGDLTVKYHLSVPSGYDITVKDDGTARKIVRASDFLQLAVFFQVHDGATFNLVASSDDIDVPTLILDGTGVATGGRSCFIDVLEGATTNIKAGVKLMNNKSNAQGAAIQCSGVLNIDGAIFDGNTHGYDTGNGGAISIFAHSTVDIKNTVFQNNTATQNGGAISAYVTQNITITNCQFNNNIAAGSNGKSGNGGAIYSESTKIVLTDCTFTGNQAKKSYGGAIGAWTNTGLEITNCSFVQNTATNSGGAIIIYTGSRATLTNCSFALPANSTETQNNYAATSGGAIADWSTGALIINGGTFANNVAKTGGAIHHNESNTAATVITGATFTANNASSAGGAIFTKATSAASEVILSDCDFTANTATGSGGGAIEAGAKTTITIKDGSTFDGNTAGSWGGAIFANAGANINVTGGSFTNNVDGSANTTHGGGAIYQYNGGKLTASGVTFSGNKADAPGGAISVSDGSSADIIGCSFDSNSTTSAKGGAIFVGSSATVTTDAITYSTEDGKLNTANGVQNDFYREGQ